MDTNIKVFEALAEDSPLACFAYDLSHKKFAYVNTAFRRLFHTGESPNLLSILSLIPETDQHYLRGIYELFNRGKVKKDIEFRMLTPNGESRYIRVIPASQSAASVHFLTGYATDVTDETENTHSLRKYANKKNSILMLLAHDLGGPLGVAQNLLQKVNEQIEDDNTRKIVSNIIKTNSQSISLINDLINRELLETSSTVLFKKRVNVVVKITEMLEEFKVARDLSKKTFTFSSSSHSILIDLDESKFIQVINNLLSNAIKFTPEHGEISISIEEQKDTVLFRFADNGIGIPTELKPFIFDKFTIAKRTGLMGEPTIGLGLSIIKMIIEWHRGRIWVESEPDQGSTFFFEIPYT